MTKIALPKPPNMFPQHLTYLNDLRETNQINMMAAAAYLSMKFPELSKDEAKDILLYWMQNHE